MKNFWKELNKPIFVLAPMEEVTDCAFREMFAIYGKPDVMFTEFVSTDGLMNEEGRKRLAIDLAYTENQRPIVAQIWGTDPEKFYQVAQYVAGLGFDGVDINMGCPQSKEIGLGACAALIREPKLAQEIIRAAQKGAGDLPVSVKTRLGYSSIDEMESWLLCLLEMNLAAITLHARTKKEMSKVPAHWDKITEAVQIRNREKSETLVIGNGDVKTRGEGLQLIAQTEADGIMIGRGAFGNPWLFRNIEEENLKRVRLSSGAKAPASTIQSKDTLEDNFPAAQASTSYAPGLPERFQVMLEHAELFERTFSGIKSFAIMRKHFKAYCSGFPGAAELRIKFMETKNLEETKKIVVEYFASNKA